MAERGQRLAAGTEPKAAEQSRGLYDVVIQACMAFRWGQREMPVIGACTELEHVGAKVRSQGRLGRHHIC